MFYTVRVTIPTMATESAPNLVALDHGSPSGERSTVFEALSGQVWIKSLTGDQPVVSILTYPTQDYAGDRVRPDGGDWTQYPAHPYVNWSHRVPIGRGSVCHRTLKYEKAVATVAVGTTAFFRSAADIEGIDLRQRHPKTKRFTNELPPYTTDEVLRCAAQAERLIRDEIATGVSIEFDVDQTRQGKDFWDIGTSLLENRPARHFENWRGLGYAHARQPVNPGCQTLAGQPSLAGAAIEKAIVIAQTGRIGSEVLCKAIMDSFLDLKNYRSPNVSVNVPAVPPPATQPTEPIITKGSDEGMTQGQGTDASAGSGETGSNKMGAGHQTAMDIAQGLMDLCQRAENNGSDDLSLRKFFKKLCGKLKDIAGDVKARAEKHKSKIDAHDSGKEDEDDDTDPMDEDDYEPSAEEKAIEINAEGAIITKSFPDWKPRRMSFANLGPETPAAAVTPAQPTNPEPTVSKKEQKAIVASRKALNKNITSLTQLLEAAAANGRL